MTHVARADLALRSVTCEASRVSFDPDRKGLAGTCGFMTRRTALRRESFARDMSRVHELHVETFLEFCREFAQGRLDRLHIVVTDRAHRLLLGICELADVATDTRVVTGEIEIERFSFTSMTRVAFELCVFGNSV